MLLRKLKTYPDFTWEITRCLYLSLSLSLLSPDFYCPLFSDHFAFFLFYTYNSYNYVNKIKKMQDLLTLDKA